MTKQDMTHRFTNHPPQDRHIGVELDNLTGLFIELACYLDDCLPEGREKSLAITKLEECSMWSKAAVARDQDRCLEKWGHK